VKEWKASEKFINHEQEDPLKDKDVLTSISTFVINTSITSSTRPNVAILDGEDSKKVGEEL
jgi:hypothetical protein